MNRELKMHNNQVIKTVSTIAISLSIILLNGCADSQVVLLDKPTVQKFDLMDPDNDGVINARDKCEKTTLGAEIDNDGCGTQIAKAKPFDLKVNFDNNSYVVPQSAKSKISELADFLKQHHSLNVVIEGHTSKVGGEQLNQVLSENRAKAVVSVLVNEFNIDAERISSKGFGFDQLAVEGEYDEAHAANRRIIAQLSATEQFDVMAWTIYSVDESL